MVRIFPFPAIIPAADKASFVATRISGQETEEEVRMFLEQNPFSYLHIVKPHIHFGEKKCCSDIHFAFARNYLSQLMEQGVLQEDTENCIYIYRQSLPDGHSFSGVIAGVSAIDYLEGTIKKHEYTLTEKENYMANHVANTHVVGEPVLLSCPDGDDLKVWITEQISGTPFSGFTDNAGSLHEIWRISNETAIEELKKTFMAKDSLYIADGHHRIAASTDFLARMHNEHNWSSKRMYFMSYIVPENDLWISSFHRLIKGLSAAEIEAIISSAAERFEVEKVNEPFTPRCKGEFGLCTPNGWYRLWFRKQAEYNSPAQNLDVARLEKYIFHDILQITDSKSDPRLQFVRGDMPARDLETLVHAGTIDVAFLVYANTMEEIKEVADADETMPPKSTWIEPKMLTGMIIQKF